MLESVGINVTPEFAAVLWPKPREKIVYGGWRSGKSSCGSSEVQLFITDVVEAALRGQLKRGRKFLIWLVGPDYGQTDQEFNYLNQWNSYFKLHSKDPSVPLEGPRHMWLLPPGQMAFAPEDRNDIEIETKSAQYLERLGSVAPDLIIMCEAGQISDEARVWIRGRSMEKRARIIYTGTLEDETAHRQWAWYIELGTEWMQDRTDEHAAYSLPTWSNRKLFPTGIDDPEIQKMKQDLYDWTGSDFAFKRRIAGEPAGTPFQVYWQLDTKDLLQEIPKNTKYVRHIGGIDYGCLTLDTEILTREGFKLHDELSLGEEVAAYDMESRSLIWTLLEGLVYKPDQPLVRIKSRSFDFTCTPDHAWLHEDWASKAQKRRRLEDIPVGSKGRLLVTAKSHEEGQLSCTPAEAAVMGWIVTDGSVQGMPWAETGKSTVSIAQKNHVPELLRDLEESGLPFTEMGTRSWGIRVFHLRSPSIRSFMQRIGYSGKESLPMIATRLSPEARERMLEAMLWAEGHKQADNWVFTQNEGPVWEAFLILATLSGYRLNPHEHIGGPGAFASDKISLRTTLHKRSYLWLPKLQEAGRADVWCPTVSTGFIVARQRGQITITGNTVHPSALAIIGITDQNVAIVRDVQWSKHLRDPGDHNWIKDTFRELSRTYNCWNWHTDPNQRFLARNFEAQAVSGSAGAREARVGLVQARLNSGKLLFDKNGPGVPDAYEEMRKVHRRKTRSGEIVYDRIDDDRTAAIEDGIEGADGQMVLELPPRILARRYKRANEPRRKNVRI